MDTLDVKRNRRFATKLFDPTRKIPDEALDDLLESLRLSPSSLGLQPWKFLVVTNRDIRQRLRAVSNAQAQVTDASHLMRAQGNRRLSDGGIRSRDGRRYLRPHDERLFDAHLLSDRLPRDE